MELQQVIDAARKKYQEVFKKEAVLGAYAPGRVNLIGEHTDYNDGFVFPMALPHATVIVGGKNEEDLCHVVTLSDHVDEPKEIMFNIFDDFKPGKPVWGNYIKGVLSNFDGKLCGFDAVIATSVPVGGGLSSSAAIEVATFTFLEQLTNSSSNFSLEEKVKACQKAEHDFLGMPCGIMDQFISFVGKKDHALLLDCRSLKYTLVPFKDPNISILITNTNVRHQLADSEYPLRKQQCDEAARIIGRTSLRDVSWDELEAHKSQLSDLVYRRAKHVISENQRTLKSVAALQREDYENFGFLMTESHKSLKHDYMVSCVELDEVVSASLECEGVFGSRMTGGGFGGCVVTLLKSQSIPHVISKIKQKFNGEPTFYVCRPADGARPIEL